MATLHLAEWPEAPHTVVVDRAPDVFATIGGHPDWGAVVPPGATWIDAVFGRCDSPDGRRGLEWSLYRRDTRALCVDTVLVDRLGDVQQIVDRREVCVAPEDHLGTVRVRAVICAVESIARVVLTLRRGESVVGRRPRATTQIGSTPLPDPAALEVVRLATELLDDGVAWQESWMRSRF